MPTTVEVVARVSRLAAGQWGLLTAAQAEREDVTRSQLTRLAEAGVLERVERGVYATTSSTDHNRALRASWLALDPAQTAEERLVDPVAAGVISHTSAAGLHKLGDLLDDVPEVTYSHRKQTRRGTRLHRGDLTEADVTLIDGLPTTTEERTVADLLRDGHDPEHIAQIIGQGVRRGVIDLSDLAEHLEPLARRYGQPDGQSLVAHLLDLVGLSPAALARDLAKSPAGQELLAAGRATAFVEIFASLLPTIDWAPVLALNKSISANILGNLDIARIAGLDKTLETFASLLPTIDWAPVLALNKSASADILGKLDIARIAGLDKTFLTTRQAMADILSPALQDAAQFRTSAAQAAIEAVQSSAVGATQPSLSSKEEGRSPATARQAQSPAAEAQEKP